MAVSGSPQLRTLRAHGLPGDVDESDLRSMFRDKDRLCSVRLAHDSAGGCCGYALLDFETQEAAALALKTYDGRMIASVHVRLRLAVAVQGGGGTALEAYQLCVGNLAADVTDSELYDRVHSFAPEIQGVKVPLDPMKRCSRGYGFVRHSPDQEPSQLMHRLQGILLRGQPLIVRVAEHGEQNMKAIWVRNVQQESVTKDWLHAAFSAFGEIESVTLSSFRNCGTVTFLERAAGVAAISLLQGAAHGKHGRMLDLRWSDSEKARPTFKNAIANIAYGCTESCKTRALADDEEKSYSREWHASMLPIAAPHIGMKPHGADINDADKMYWLSRSLCMSFETSASKRSRLDEAE